MNEVDPAAAVAISELRLEITPDGMVRLDLKVDGRWRRVINAVHAGWTSHYVTGRGMQLGEGVSDVTEEYEEIERWGIGEIKTK